MCKKNRPLNRPFRDFTYYNVQDIAPCCIHNYLLIFLPTTAATARTHIVFDNTISTQSENEFLNEIYNGQEEYMFSLDIFSSCSHHLIMLPSIYALLYGLHGIMLLF